MINTFSSPLNTKKVDIRNGKVNVGANRKACQDSKFLTETTNTGIKDDADIEIFSGDIGRDAEGNLCLIIYDNEDCRYYLRLLAYPEEDNKVLEDWEDYPLCSKDIFIIEGNIWMPKYSEYLKELIK